MRIDAKQLKRVDLVKVTGRVDSSNAHELERHLNDAMKLERYRIVLDFSGLDFLSSAGIRVLITAAKAARRWNRGDVRVSGLSDRLKETFALAGLKPVIRAFDTTVDAVGSF